MTATHDDTRMIDGVQLMPQEVASIGRPTYSNVEDERRARKIGLAAALRVFGRLGYGEGVAGHITARDPEFTDCFWVNPFGKSFRHMKTSDLILVNHDGEVVYGTQPVNRAAFVLHAAIHKARPEVIGAAHAHSTYGKAWASLGRSLIPSPKTHAFFMTTTPSSQNKVERWCLKLQPVKNSLRSSLKARLRFTRTTDCSPLAPRLKQQRFGSSRWIAVAKHSCLLKLQEHRN
jgi:hypothetical protein